MKKWFDTKHQAVKARDERNGKGFKHFSVFKKKWGRNKGRFYVGTEFEFLNLNS